jgi:hypothetical protein
MDSAYGCGLTDDLMQKGHDMSCPYNTVRESALQGSKSPCDASKLRIALEKSLIALAGFHRVSAPDFPNPVIVNRILTLGVRNPNESVTLNRVRLVL